MLVMLPYSAHACVDTVGWFNDYTCDDYRQNNFCPNGILLSTFAGTGADLNCCECGKENMLTPEGEAIPVSGCMITNP